MSTGCRNALPGPWTASSVAPVSCGYERALRPGHEPAIAPRQRVSHSETSPLPPCLRSHGGSVRRFMLIRLGYSADPDDAFMFWGLDSGSVDTRGFRFEHVVRDIQTLNEWALEARLEVTALSLATYPLVQDRYLLLPHGASMGSGYGPVVVTRERWTIDDLRSVEVVVPGRLTTALLVLRLALGTELRWRELPFDEIADEVSSGRADAGLLIHEGQLTFGAEGLQKSLDLGEWWL